MELAEQILVEMNYQKTESNSSRIQKALEASWPKIAPFWPLKNLIAINPLYGFEDLPFEEAIKMGKIYFGQETLPDKMKKVNIETIKWLQAFFDEGQSTINMPLRNLGLLKSVHNLLKFDYKVVSSDYKKTTFKLKDKLPENIYSIIEECLLYLGIPDDKYNEYLTLMLTTLPGWASYIQYKASWEYCKDKNNLYSSSKEEYIALRLLMVCLIYPQGKQLLDYLNNYATQNNYECNTQINRIKLLEIEYRNNLLQNISERIKIDSIDNIEISEVEAQLVFCIDVRSEGFRRRIENIGNYKTYGFAGFFGIPVSIKNEINNEIYNSCPALLNPAHSVIINNNDNIAKKAFKRSKLLTKIYQSLKYNITTPFGLVESLGIISGLLMIGRTFFPKLFYQLSHKFNNYYEDFVSSVSLDAIPLKNQCEYAINALRIMGLVNNFAPMIVFCGHGSETKNNAYATALDCGACGGRHGGINALILASILNKNEVRSYLAEQGIFIPKHTYFIAAEHNTTTDSVKIYDNYLPPEAMINIEKLKTDLLKAKEFNSRDRFFKLGDIKKSVLSPDIRAKDWAQIRPEWGLAGNASFIVGPREITKGISLDGRSFLHSYDWKIDKDGSLLTVILTASMVVAQWINAQYLFSTLDNVAFGGGSKITKNITGKIGIMQGNASDLMNGLPLQSVFKSDQEAYHEPVRLLTLVYAPRSLIDQIISKQDILKKLFGNEWVMLTCIDPLDNNLYRLTKDLKWILN